ncbi:SHQ1 protein-domain-containing protein [Suillus cothurnatus]|nr:SHQ1 protein-domain-containing protein [Suillus cothurnatus]
MITPRFSCTQTREAVAVSIYCPSVRASDVEINVDETLLTSLDDDQSSAIYDPSSGYLTVTLTKETKGQEFPDLDLLAKLLAPRHVEVPKQPTIEVIGELEELVDLTDAISLEQREILEAAENDWQFPQTILESSSPLQLSTKRYYGFLDMYTGYFTHVAHTENDVNELGSEAESSIFRVCFILITEHITTDLPTSSQQRNLYLTLLTLLFAYAYDRRTTQHDPTPESAWTIAHLKRSSVYPHVGVHRSRLASALMPSYRRSLAFPLYRSFAMADAYETCLDHHEVYYVYNKIWVDDFCVWIQLSASDEMLLDIAQQLKALAITKSMIGWNIEKLEATTLLDPTSTTATTSPLNDLMRSCLVFKLSHYFRDFKFGGFAHAHAALIHRQSKKA